MRATPSDKEIMAYADGTLSGARRCAVQRAWASDAEVRHLVHEFRLTQIVIGEAFADIEETAASRELVAELLRQPDATAGSLQTSGGGTAVPSRSAVTVMVLAALIMALAGVAPRDGGDQQPMGLQIGEVAADSPLVIQLNAVVDGHVLTEEGQRLAIAQTLTDKFGNACWEINAHSNKEFSILDTVFVACRNANLSWSVIAALRTKPFKSADQGTYVIGTRDAHAAFAGLRETIGHKHRTTEIKDESSTR
ncbi:MAG: hypothetical protein NW217_15880 [Hyphomicrobiaceae bacterium]|nr:hypothetical protein [Hyphomicrobiaceae bacterium]